MSNDITIPPEAVRALRAALTACDCDKCLCDMIRAALNAWPGAHTSCQCIGCGDDVQIILPLPQENTNAKS